MRSRRSSIAAALAGAALCGSLALAAGAPHAQPAGDAAKGEAAFNDVCTQCHTIGAVAAGPNLAGVVGRKAGSLPDYPYTAQMKGSGLVWTGANLERFLANPAAVVPGTAMTGVSVASAADRANIVAYLATQKAH
jgi:cytochrome c